MKKIISALVIIILFGVSAFYVLSNNRKEEHFLALRNSPPHGEIFTYWKNNKAEISSYELKQVRYGEIREGKAVMIFVTEPFLPKSQVKYDGIRTEEKYVDVLKLNIERTFATGIYTYSMMTSVFTPFLAIPTSPIKITTSSQDWCGHTFFQLNNRKNEFEVLSYSYFQKFGDEKILLAKDYLEDELWNIIRIDPSSLPLGNIRIIPSSQSIRLLHLEPSAMNAEASLTTFIDQNKGEEFYSYRINYSDAERSIIIFFEKDIPHKILGWSESNLEVDSNGEQRIMTTEAKLANSINTDYWNKNENADSVYRSNLGF